VHSASPTVEAIVGGLASPASDFLVQMYTSGGGRSGLFDGVAIHPYAATPPAVLAEVEKVRALLDAHGDIDVPLDVTEFGWPTRGLNGSGTPPILSDLRRGVYLAQVTAALASSDCGVERIFPHTWVSKEINPLAPDDWFGLVHPNGVLTQSEVAYSQAITALERQPAARATMVLCRAAPTITAVQQAPASTGARSTAAAHGNGSKHRRRVYRGCAVVTLASGSAAVNGATVRFAFHRVAGWQAATPRVVRAATGSGGQATACVTSKRPTRGRFTITATRPDFVQVVSSTVGVVVR
jgi:hypothetical protein